jgi:hypothetical protein
MSKAVKQPGSKANGKRARGAQPNGNEASSTTRLTPTIASLVLKTPTKSTNGELTYIDSLGHLEDGDDDEALESPRKKEKMSQPARKSVLEELPTAASVQNGTPRTFSRPPMLMIANPAGKSPAAESASNVAAAAQELQDFQQEEESVNEASVVTPKTTTHRSSLHAAILHGDIPAVKRLLGASICKLSFAAVDPSYLLCAENSSTSNIKNRKDDNGFTALMNAASLTDEAVSLELCKLLLGADVELEQVDGYGMSAVHWAATSGNVEVLRLLVKQGLSPHATCAAMELPLHRAARAGKAEVVQVLLEEMNGLQLQHTHARNERFATAFDVAGVVSDSDKEGTSGRHQHMLMRGGWGSRGPKINAVDRSAVRRQFLLSDPTLRTLVLSHDACLGHVTRVDHQESPLRQVEIMAAIRDQIHFSEHEIELSNEFSKAPQYMLERAHSAQYIELVIKLSEHIDLQSGALLPFTPHVQRRLKDAVMKEQGYKDLHFNGSDGAGGGGGGAVVSGSLFDFSAMPQVGSATVPVLNFNKGGAVGGAFGSPSPASNGSSASTGSSASNGSSARASSSVAGPVIMAPTPVAHSDTCFSQGSLEGCLMAAGTARVHLLIVQSANSTIYQ